jgi:HSP20 family protein
MTMQRYNLDKLMDWFADDYNISPFNHSLLSLYNPQSRSMKALHQYNLPADMIEHDDRYEIVVDCPGLSEEDITVEQKEGYITIGGEVSLSSNKTNERIIFQERSYSKFNRSFKLPKNVDINRVQANLDKGVLTVSLHKLEQTQHKTRRIDINKKELSSMRKLST